MELSHNVDIASPGRSQSPSRQAFSEGNITPAIPIESLECSGSEESFAQYQPCNAELPLFLETSVGMVTP